MEQQQEQQPWRACCQKQTKQLSEQDLSPDQGRAFDELLDWASKTKSNSQISLGGYAGTGKTTLLKLLTDRIDGRIHIMSLTGKAVSVLIKKGMPAQTIHSSIYYVHVEKKKLIFTLRDSIEGRPNLLIIDEASMVSTEVYKDLLSFSIPILWVGDHGQLEPVGRNPGVMKDPIIKLEQIHRQAANNPIIRFADRIRKGAQPAAIASKHDETIRVIHKQGIHDEDLLETDQMIVAMNRTRVKFNKYVRKLQGRERQDSPSPGDRVICLKNNRQQGIYNGLQGILRVYALPSPSSPTAYAVVELDNGRTWEGDMVVAQFNNIKGLVDTDKALWKHTHWDYAYAITCHKSQGSEWDKVLVLEERCPLWEMPRWRYTAVTRASEELIYAC